MDEFPANSRKPVIRRESVPPVGQEAIESRKIEKIIDGEVHIRKKPLGKRFAETFFGGTAKGAAKHVITEVLLPAARDAIFDAFSQGIERVVYGESRGGGRRTVNRGGPQSGHNGYVNYNRFAQSGPPKPARDLSRQARSNHSLDELVFEHRHQAQSVLERMFDHIQKYDSCPVSELYGMVGITPTFTDEKWGWIDISDAHVARAGREGYVLDLPKPEFLD